MMSLKRLLIVFLLLGLGFAGTAFGGTHKYSLGNGSGGQLQIGGGLPLPIQATCNATCTGTHFPPLLIERVLSASVSQTTTRTTGQKLIVPKGVLSKPASFKILGQRDNNPRLYAVATNIKYTWPAAAAMFSTAGRAGATTTTIPGGVIAGSITYKNSLGRKFGGPANFALSLGTPGTPGGAGPPGDLNAKAAATLYLIALGTPGDPPCTHTAFLTTATPPGPIPTAVAGNPTPACVAAIGNVLPTGGTTLPTGFAAAGGGQPATPFTTTTPGGTSMAFTHGTPYGPKPGIGIVKAGTGFLKPGQPRGTISLFAFTPGLMTGFTNMASSSGFPWTTGMLTIVAPGAGGGGESWKVTGMDNRNAKGVGTIKMVSGALSARSGTGDNANRGWVKLVLNRSPEPGVPALSPASLAAMAALMLLVAGYAMRRRLFA